MTADEQQPQRVVANLHLGFGCPVRSGSHLLVMGDDRGLLRGRHLAVAERVLGEVERDAHDPRRRVGWDPAHRPGANRPQHRFLRDVLGQRQIVHAEQADQGAVQPAQFVPEEMLDQLAGPRGLRGRVHRRRREPWRCMLQLSDRRRRGDRRKQGPESR